MQRERTDFLISKDWLAHAQIDEFPTYEQWCLFLPATAPSRHAVTGCFLASFWEKSSLLDKHMQCTTIPDEDSWLSCDHKFASVVAFYQPIE